MDIVLMIVYLTIVLGILVFIHEAGHYLAARAFGVRVTEFMLGLPGPSIGATWKGTRFGVTAIPLGGYARICGMEPGEQSPHLEKTLALVYEKGTVNMEDVAAALGITDEEAYTALDELSEWGSIAGPTKKDAFNTYRAPAVKGSYEVGEARVLKDPPTFFESEYKQQYRSLPFWKRSIILLAGVAMNLLFVIVAVVVLYSIIGVDVTNAQGELQHVTLGLWQSIMGAFQYIGVYITTIAGLFNPATAGEVISSSSSIVGIAAYSKYAADMGFAYFLQFMILVSLSLGIMNLLPIPPLDGGRFVVEIFQKISKKLVSPKALNYMSTVGILLFVGLFLVLTNQDIQRLMSGTLIPG